VDLTSTPSFLSELDNFSFNVDLDLDVHREGEAGYLIMLPLHSLQAPMLSGKWTSPMASKNSDHALLCSPPPLTTSPSPMLKSRWSSSTIGSICKEHEQRGPSAKLRLYWGSKNSKVPQMSMLMKSPSHTSYAKKSHFLHHDDKEPPWIWAWMSFELQVRCSVHLNMVMGSV